MKGTVREWDSALSAVALLCETPVCEAESLHLSVCVCVCSMNYTCGETSQPGATTPEPFLRSLVSASALWGSVILTVRPR